MTASDVFLVGVVAGVVWLAVGVLVALAVGCVLRRTWSAETAAGDVPPRLRSLSEQTR